MTKKSSFPDLKEFMGYAGKLVKDMRSSVSGIITEYKRQRTTVGDESEAPTASTESKKEAPTVQTKPKKTTSDKPETPTEKKAASKKSS